MAFQTCLRRNRSLGRYLHGIEVTGGIFVALCVSSIGSSLLLSHDRRCGRGPRPLDVVIMLAMTQRGRMLLWASRLLCWWALRYI